MATGKTVAKKTAKKSTVAVAEKAALQQARTSMVNVTIGRRVYPVKRDPRCVVCMHPGCGQIEERILFNEGYRSIAEWASDHDAERYDGELVAWPQIEAKDIARHYRAGHCPIDARVLHELQAQRSGEVDYEQLAGRVVDYAVFAQQTVARTHERAVRGEIEPTFKEGLAAGKLLADIQRADRDTEAQDTSWAMEEAFAVYFETAKMIMSEDQWEQFSVRLTQNPTLQGLIERVQNPDAIVDAEIVEDTPR